MKKLLIALAIATSSFATQSMAADIEAGIVKNVIDQSALAQDDLSIISPLNLLGAEIDSSKLKGNSLTINNVSPSAAAQGIEYFEIAAVTSFGAAYENITASQFSTVGNHGGSQIRVWVLQYGYGNPNNATLGSSSISATSSSVRCGTNLHVCSVGETVTGFLYQYDFFGPQSGQLSVSANSIASPLGFWSDSLYIQ